MAILSGTQISRLVQTEELVLNPFDPQLVQPASYDLRLGHKLLASPLSQDILGSIVELNGKSPSYNVQSGQMVAAISAEHLELPLGICGRVGIRSEFARTGMNAFGGPQIDPGYEGKVTLSLINVGPEPITLTLGVSFFTIEFQRLDEPATAGYDGDYQGMDDFPPDQYEFIMKARTTSLAEIPTLRQEVHRLHLVIEEWQELLPDLDEDLQVRPEVAERLRKSLESGKLLSLDEARKNLTA